MVKSCRPSATEAQRHREKQNYNFFVFLCVSVSLWQNLNYSIPLCLCVSVAELLFSGPLWRSWNFVVSHGNFGYISRMSESVESFLKKIMEGAGRFVEKIIGEAHKAKVSVGTRSGIKPILSLESQFSAAKLKELVNFATERICVPAIPNLKDQATLEIGEGPSNLLPKFFGQQARAALGFEIGGGLTGRQGDSSRGYITRGHATNLPFGKDYFDYVGARLATSLQGDIIKAVKEIGRVMAPGGQGFFSDFHPFGLYAKKGTDRARSVESTIRGIEDYYKICKSAGLRIVDLREAFIDETFRSLFEADEVQAYRNVKGTPLMVFIFFFKPRTK